MANRMVEQHCPDAVCLVVHGRGVNALYRDASKPEYREGRGREMHTIQDCQGSSRDARHQHFSRSPNLMDALHMNKLRQAQRPDEMSYVACLVALSIAMLHQEQQQLLMRNTLLGRPPVSGSIQASVADMVLDEISCFCTTCRHHTE